MEIPHSRWYGAIPGRRSRRRYDPARTLEPDMLAALERVCREFTPFPHARSRLVTQPATDVFKGVLGSYGRVTGAPAFIAFIGDMRAPSVQEEVGYMGEGIILEATALGLNTCWVGGFFKPESVAALVQLRDYERVLAVTPVGYAERTQSFGETIMTGFGLTHRRLQVSRLLVGRVDDLPVWARAALEAARLAPSAVNRQPWGFEVDEGGMTVSVRSGVPDFNVSKRLDCGIAMLHIEVAALTCGIRGSWELLEAPRVGRYRIEAKEPIK